MGAIRETLMQVAHESLLQALKEKGIPAPADLTPQTELFGRAGLLDSLGIVTMVMEMEQRLDQEHSLTVVLADERAVSRRNSPFKTLDALVDYVEEQLQAGAP